MKSATNVQPSAGHGNGSVRTQNQPAWSSLVSSTQTSSSSSSSSVVSVPRRVSWASTRARLDGREALPAGNRFDRTQPAPGRPRLALRHGLAPELHGEGDDLRAAVRLHVHALTGLEVREHVAQLVRGADLLPPDGDDYVAAEDVALAGDDDVGRPALQTRFLRRAAGRDAFDENAFVDG